MRNTCRNCTKRTIGCHATCEEYQAAKLMHDAERADYKERYRVARSAATIRAAHQKLKEGGKYGG